MKEGLNSVEPSSKKAISTREPFIIRGHHFENFINLSRKRVTSKELAKGMRDLTEIRRAEAIIVSKISKNKETRDAAIGYQRYAEDTIGGTLREADMHEQNLLKIFNEFSDLPGTHPVKLVIGEDSICRRACIEGKHCKLNDQSFYGAGSKSLLEDKSYLDVFKDIAQKQGQSITIIEEIVKFTDIGPQKTQSIITTAKVVKNVFQDRSFRIRLRNKITKLDEENI